MKVAVVDYGMGNLHSVLKSVQAAQSLSSKTAEIYLTDRRRVGRRQNHLPRTRRDARLHGRAA